MDPELQQWGFVSPADHRNAIERVQAEMERREKAAFTKGRRSSRIDWFYMMDNDAKAGAVFIALFALFILTCLGLWIFNVVIDEPEPRVDPASQNEFFELEGRECVRVPHPRSGERGLGELDPLVFCNNG